MKNLVYTIILLVISVVIGCKSGSQNLTEKGDAKKFSDTVKIANDSLEYEVIVIDAGFNSWLYSTARPRGYYSQNYLEARNIPWVLEWNMRARTPRNNRESSLFQMPIDYQSGTNYGYEVNYLLYNYLVYFQIKNNIRLGGFAPHP